MTVIATFGDLVISVWRGEKALIMLAAGNGYFQSPENAHNIAF